MCIWNKILVGLISVASLVFFYMAARTLQMQKNWEECAQKHQARIDQLNEESKVLLDGVDGDPSKPGLRVVRRELYRLLIDRRRVWEHGDPAIRLGNGSAEVTVTFAAPHGVTSKKIVLYAFEEADVRQKGRYMGEFAVTSVDVQKLTMTPTSKLTPSEIEKLKTFKRPWVLYEMMPRDGHDFFTSLTDDQKKAILPVETAMEYLKDGKPAAKDDPIDRVDDQKKYVRLLRDYGILLNNEREKLILLNDSIEAATRDKQLVVEALALAREAEEACKRDIAVAVQDKAKAVGDRDIVKEHLDRVEGKLKSVLTEIAQMLESNKAMVGRIAQFQLEAAKRIDQRARAMAQTGSERF
jgi:hypothetical protein